MESRWTARNRRQQQRIIIIIIIIILLLLSFATRYYATSSSSSSSFSKKPQNPKQKIQKQPFEKPVDFFPSTKFARDLRERDC